VLIVLDFHDKNNLEMKTPGLRGSGNLDDKTGDRRLVIIAINELELRNDLKSVSSREQAGKDGGPSSRPIPHAFHRRRISGVILQRKGGKRHLARRRKNYVETQGQW
jgi:hypothetical protein